MRYFFTAIIVLRTLGLWAQVPANDECSSPTSLGTLGNPGSCGSGIKKGTTTTLAGTNANATPGNPYYPGL